MKEFMREMIDMGIMADFTEGTEAGKSLEQIMTDMIKNDDAKDEIIENYEKVFGKTPEYGEIELGRFQTKLHALDIISMDDVFNKEAKRWELANYMIELANELKTIRGDFDE